MKPRGVIILEGALYVVIASGASVVSLLESDAPLTERSIAAAAVAAVLAGATALKAFLSQAYRPEAGGQRSEAGGQRSEAGGQRTHV